MSLLCFTTVFKLFLCGAFVFEHFQGICVKINPILLASQVVDGYKSRFLSIICDRTDRRRRRLQPGWTTVCRVSKIVDFCNNVAAHCDEFETIRMYYIVASLTSQFLKNLKELSSFV
jgi:hypothetical protein